MKKSKLYLSYFILITSILSGCSKKEKLVINEPTKLESEVVDDLIVSQVIDTEEVSETEEKTTEVKEPTVIELMMIGDVLVHTKVYKSGIKSDGSYNFDHLFFNIKGEIEDADIKIVNQETILGGTELGLSSYPCFNSPQEIGVAEATAGFNYILHSTNHTLDRGIDAINNTIEFWKTLYPDINVVGLNDTDEDVEKISVYEEDDFKVAILNYTYGTNGIRAPKSKPYVVNILSEERITEDVRKAKEIADMVVVCPHWGTEYVYKPDNQQKKYTKLFYDLGVDVVIGTHPHVLEPVEIVKDENSDHEMLVYYSLGNFISSQTEIPRMIGGLAKVTLVKDYENNECYIDSYELLPVVTQQGEYTTYLLFDYTDELAKQNQIRRYSGCSNFSFDYINDLCSSILGSDYNKDEYSLKKKLR